MGLAATLKEISYYYRCDLGYKYWGGVRVEEGQFERKPFGLHVNSLIIFFSVTIQRPRVRIP